MECKSPSTEGEPSAKERARIENSSFSIPSPPRGYFPRPRVGGRELFKLSSSAARPRGPAQLKTHGREVWSRGREPEETLMIQPNTFDPYRKIHFTLGVQAMAVPRGISGVVSTEVMWGIFPPATQKKVEKLNSRVHLRISFDGGYHVLDELTHYSSDLRPTGRQLWKPAIGVLEIGILSAQNLTAMKTKDGRGFTDAYCVAKYGQKWIRTRTILNNFNPKWNEQYTWEVYDPCTVITIGVFDNSQLQGGNANSNGNANAKDSKIGKVRIRLSTLETDRVYTHSYPLIVLSPSGVKKMGEIQLAVRFSCASLINMLTMYTQPLLPNLHYIHPLTTHQIEILRHQATQIVSTRLSRAEPPLRKEVVEYMLDVGSNMWSVRRSKANHSRIAWILSALVKIIKWFDQICEWKSPFITILVHILFLAFVCFPWMIFSTIFFYLFLIGTWNYRLRPRHPPHMDVRLSQADVAQKDELEEEFDTFPTSLKQVDVVKMRYDRLRAIASRVQTLFGDLATQGERFYNLLTWRDPRATALFLIFCLVASLVLYVTPPKAVISVMGFYTMRHPRFRDQLPSYPMNFLRRLPAKTDGLL
ncbi:hypothetical protein RD792_015557 [Penstemon davidsonii]|uniref:C2 domain-containing protein n=1 Tax=Penstemon davidsonii TaxID=160366 RepID=A0ABR0CIW1_9LAMI|nr:hypothetical protein RD792_015557 [Penstemon davidsonii]